MSHTGTKTPEVAPQSASVKHRLPVVTASAGLLQQQKKQLRFPLLFFFPLPMSLDKKACFAAAALSLSTPAPHAHELTPETFTFSGDETVHHLLTAYEAANMRSFLLASNCATIDPDINTGGGFNVYNLDINNLMSSEFA